MAKRLIIAIVIILSLMLMAVSSQAATIGGHVVAPVNRQIQQIDSARVVLQQIFVGRDVPPGRPINTIMTNGIFVFRNIAPGVYMISAASRFGVGATMVTVRRADVRTVIVLRRDR